MIHGGENYDREDEFVNITGPKSDIDRVTARISPAIPHSS